MANSVQVRTGPSSYLNFSEADAKEWRKANKEYTDADAQPSGPVSTTEAREQGVFEDDPDSEFPMQEGELPPFADWNVAGLKQQAAEWELSVPGNANKASLVELVQAEYDRRQRLEAEPIESDDESDESDG